MRILVADDDVASRTILTMLLEKNGHTVFNCDNGTEALAALTKQDHPELAILDWLMPGLDGIEVCQKLRSSEKGLPVYIIMLTIKGEKNDIVQGLDSGANDYISKPYDPGELHARILAGERIIGLQKELKNRADEATASALQIKSLLGEKETLLFEIHSRVKNNLQTISNMLTLQVDTLQDPKAALALHNTIARIANMGILHDRLYRDGTSDSLSVKAYVEQLVSNIAGLYPDHKKVSFDYDIADFPVDTGQISKIGMIINELVMNSMQYAFKGRDSGEVLISIRKQEGVIRLGFEDNGTGLPDTVDPENPGTFGLKLVRGMCRQLNGTFTVDRSKGSGYKFHFAG